MLKRSLLQKLLVAAAVTVSVGLTSGSAFAADVLPDFTVAPAVFGGPAPFVADKITGNYNEVLTVTGNAFSTVAYWDAGQFVTTDGTVPLNANQTGLGSQYGIYALFTSNGTFAPNATGSFDFTATTGTLQVWVDDNLNSTPKVLPATAPGVIAVPNTGDDTLLATATLVKGEGKGGGALASGDFGLLFSPFVLTPTGSSYFIAPSPFYLDLILKGQFNSFVPVGTQTINGSADAFFAVVPEPSTLVLFGLGLIGVARQYRRRMSA